MRQLQSKSRGIRGHRGPRPLNRHLPHLRELREAANLNLADIAHHVGVSISTVSRWETAKYAVSPKAINRLAKVLNTSAEVVLQGPLSGVPGIVEVVGMVQAGIWRDALEWDAGARYSVSMPPNVPYKTAPKFGLEVRGASMDRHYPEGSVVFCVPAKHMGRPLRNGDHVVTQRTARDGSVEATIKEIRIDPQGKVWLWPRSHDPEYQTPARLYDDGTSSIEVTALVIGHSSWRPQ